MNAILSTALLIFVFHQSSGDEVSRAKRAAIEPFQPFVGATKAAVETNDASSLDSDTDDPIGQGYHSGAVKVAILIAGVIGLGVLLVVCFAWKMMPKDDPNERNPLLNGVKVTGGLFTRIGLPVGFQMVLAVFIRLQCASFNVYQLVYRFLLLRRAESNKQHPAILITIFGVAFNLFICSVLIPLSITTVEQFPTDEYIRTHFLPEGRWLLNVPSIIVIPTFSSSTSYTIFGILSIIASVISALLFTMTSKRIIKILNDSQRKLSRTTVIQHTRAIAALKAQSTIPLIVVTLPLNILMVSSSWLPNLSSAGYTIILAMPALMSIFAFAITISFQISYRRFFISLLKCQIAKMKTPRTSINHSTVQSRQY